MHRARVPEINSHPSGGIDLVSRLRADTAGGSFVLRLPGQHVVVTALPVVKKCSHRSQELERGHQFGLRGFRQQRLRRRPAAFLVHRGKQRHPAGDVVVAQSARSLLDVRFQMKHCVSVLRMARARHLRQLLDNVVPFPQKKLGQDFFMQPLEQLAVSGDMPAIQEGNRELDILRIELLAFIESSRGRTEFQPEIPKFLAERAYRIAQLVFSAAVGVQKKNVHVGMREQGATPKSAKRH